MTTTTLAIGDVTMHSKMTSKEGGEEIELREAVVVMFVFKSKTLARKHIFAAMLIYHLRMAAL